MEDTRTHRSQSGKAACLTTDGRDSLWETWGTCQLSTACPRCRYASSFCEATRGYLCYPSRLQHTNSQETQRGRELIAEWGVRRSRNEEKARHIRKALNDEY